MKRPDISLSMIAISTLLVVAAAHAASVPPLATGDSRRVLPPFPPSVCTVLQAQFSTSQRSSPPSSDDTSRLQAALDSCAGTGKSVVLAPSAPLIPWLPPPANPPQNAFFSGTLKVSGEAIVVEWGVTLYGNDSYSSELISLTGTNSAIMGPGTIDGRGDLISGTPRLINAKNITNFTVSYVTLQHPGKMHLYVEDGSGLTVWGTIIATPANTKNTDGIDIDSLTNATVFGCYIEDGDDGVAIKTNSGPASNITIMDNTFHGTHGMSIGSQTMYGVTNVLWQNNAVFGTDQWGNVSTDNNGIRIKSDVECGGPVQQVTYNNTFMTGVKHLLIFNSYYGSCSGITGTPYYTDIVVNGVYAINSQSGGYSEFNGYSADFLLGLTLENVKLDVTAQQNSQYANVGLFNSNITPAGTGVTTFPVVPQWPF
ncbi:MAG: glycosyl hydrolase family 28 protein [Bryobacteraceae bacterium]|jgi:polygalacturonase